MAFSSWKYCLERLEGELAPQQFNTWIRPLHAVEDNSSILLLAPNRFVMDWVNDQYLSKIKDLLNKSPGNSNISISIEVGSQSVRPDEPKKRNGVVRAEPQQRTTKQSNNLNPDFTFDSFIEGKSNQLARAASLQTSQNPGKSYNPLFIYGGVGLGKTHLVNAIGHHIQSKSPRMKVAYLSSEQFTNELINRMSH